MVSAVIVPVANIYTRRDDHGNDQAHQNHLASVRGVPGRSEGPNQRTRPSRNTRASSSLYGSYLESYWPGHDGEYDKITKAGGTYCSTFGPEDATDGYSEFLGYFMPRKVMCGKDTMQAAGTVTKKLAKWLAEKGYIEDTEYEQERAGEAAKDLPNAAGSSRSAQCLLR